MARRVYHFVPRSNAASVPNTTATQVIRTNKLNKENVARGFRFRATTNIANNSARNQCGTDMNNALFLPAGTEAQ